MHPVQIQGLYGSYLCDIIPYGYSYNQVRVRKLKRYKFGIFSWTRKTVVFKTGASSYCGLDRNDRAERASPTEICEWYKASVSRYEEEMRTMLDNSKKWADFYEVQKSLPKTTNSTGPK